MPLLGQDAIPDLFNPIPSSSAHAIAIQTNGSILWGGFFTSVGGVPRKYLARLSGEGMVDTTFPEANENVFAFAVQDNGAIVVGGQFTAIGTTTRNLLARVSAGGALESFDPNGSGGVPSSYVRSLALQRDGRILAAGNFSAWGSTQRYGFCRLKPEGNVDESINLTLPGNSYCVLVQADGKIVVGGGALIYGALTRINPEGTLDTNFSPAVTGGGVWTAVLQPDGRILIGGEFTSVGGQVHKRLARLNADGSVDPDFNPDVNQRVTSICVQENGKIILGGQFTSISGNPITNIARLHSDGSLDPTFNLRIGNLSTAVRSLAIQADGKLLVSGTFTSVCGEPHTNACRILPTEPAINELVLEGDVLKWRRGGSSPAISCPILEHSTDGVTWVELPTPVRTSDGYALSGISGLPAGTLRARGSVTGGYYNGSSWWVETRMAFIPPPRILSEELRSMTSGAGIAFRYRGVLDHTAVVESSSDLCTWSGVQTNVCSDDPILFQDTNTTGVPHRFYRIRSIPAGEGN